MLLYSDGRGARWKKAPTISLATLLGVPMRSSNTRAQSTRGCMIGRIINQVVKLFSNSIQPVPDSYRPGKFVAVAKDVVSGGPDLS